MRIFDIEREIDGFHGFRRASRFLYDPTVFTLINGTDAVLDEVWSYQVATKFKNNWYAATAPSDMQNGMVFVDSDNGVAYLRHSALMIPLGQMLVANKTDSYVVTTSDLNSVLTMTAATAKTFTLCSISATHIGDFIVFAKLGAGQVTITRADADTINGQTSIYNNLADELYSFICLRIISATAWAMAWATNPFSWVLA